MINNSIKTPNILWIDASRVGNSYNELYEAIASIVGEGEEITPEMIGKTQRDFGFDKIMFVVLRDTEIIYSYQPDTGEFSPEFVGTYITKH